MQLLSPKIGSFTKFIGWCVGSCMIGGPPKNLTKTVGFLKCEQNNVNTPKMINIPYICFCKYKIKIYLRRNF